MSVPAYTTLVLDLFDAQGNPVTTGSVTLTPSVSLTDTPDLMVIPPVPVTVSLLPTAQRQTARILASDSPGPLPAGWGWNASFNLAGAIPAFSFFNPAGPAAFTATSANPAVFTWTLPGSNPWQLRSLPNGTGIQLSGGSLPGGFTAATTYYVVNASGLTFELATTQGGTPIASTSAGSGQLTAVQYNLSALSPVSSVTAMAAYFTSPTGTPAAGMTVVATGPASWQWTTPPQNIDGGSAAGGLVAAGLINGGSASG